jgi:uncharacterized protein with von Willebrand factor type A (vWA) domain
MKGWHDTAFCKLADAGRAWARAERDGQGADAALEALKAAARAELVETEQRREHFDAAYRAAGWRVIP